MPKHAIPGYARLNRTHKLSAAGVAAAGAAALVFAVVPGSADAKEGNDQAAVQNVKPVAFSAVDNAAKTQQDTIGKQADASAQQAEKDAAEAKKKAADEAKAKEEADAKAKADQERKDQETASRSSDRAAAPAPEQAKTYSNDLDGWIRESLDIMQKQGIPGSYEGIQRNIMRESTGNPQAVNGYDSNAQQGTPSKGLLQVIDPTFQAYHVDGTSWDIFDPVANITAACKYAAATYGSMDNVDSAY
ncbi:lytic transglycosylase [Streptomyces sp. CB02923]|uniref:transglycosylase SLT domain-containing protein n=1 Tax=Streptomyces sp. CB02923 TaxID=1718985 RepID=UPI0009398D7F|nr:transglycosylase SLT domain-containing protein [Streptomyces sp. CB02923]OKI08178.1 lytic transglycosylase [Streptomyces sp. CB02923]